MTGRFVGIIPACSCRRYFIDSGTLDCGYSRFNLILGSIAERLVIDVESVRGVFKMGGGLRSAWF